MKIKNFILNDKEISAAVPDGVVLLDYLRRNKRLTGTKEGCREGDCGACAVLVGELQGQALRYRVVNSCLFPMIKTPGKHIVTIEGLQISEANPLFSAFVNEHASQCGYCTPGIIISLTGYFLSGAGYSAAEAVQALDGNICRCTGYASIIRAAKTVCDILRKNRVTGMEDLIKAGVAPCYFRTIPNRLPKREHGGPSESTAALVAGGTDLFVQRPEELLQTGLRVVEKSKAPVWQEKRVCFIDGAATVSDMVASPLLSSLFPGFREQLGLVSSTPIRNEATVAGNIVNASPIADLTIFLLALNSTLTICRNSQERRLSLDHFSLDYKKIDLQAEEVIKNLYFEIPEEPFFFNFEKVSKRTYLDIASVNSAALVQMENYRIKRCSISAGGVAPIPLLLSKTSEFLIGKEANKTTLRQATEVALSEINPISDVRGSARYKSRLLQNLIAAHFFRFFPHLEQKEVLL